MMETTTTETAETAERKTETINHFFHLLTANSIYTISLREKVAVPSPISSNFGYLSSVFD
jgi:hypothetical protein